MYLTSRHPLSRIPAVLALALTALLLAVNRPALAQFHAPNVNLSDEERAKVWKIQSDTIARELGLNADSAAKLAEAYAKTRGAQMRAVANAAKADEGDTAQILVAVAGAQKKEQKAFNEAIKGFVTAKQMPRVNQTLGSYEAMWDLYLNMLTKLKLSDEERAAAEASLLAYVEEVGPTRQKAFGAGDMAAVQQSLRSGKDMLRKRLEKDLTPKNFEAWEQLAPKKRRATGKD